MLKFLKTANFGEIRTVEINGIPYFVGKDVADILGYSNPRDALSCHVDDEDKNTVVFSDGTSGNPNMTVINESGLYSLILSSKLPTAKKFKHWVTSEVLPIIRKTGGYVAEDREEEFINQYFPAFSEETKLQMVCDLRNQNVKLKEANNELSEKNKQLSEENSNLELDNKALAQGNLTWSNRSMFNYAIRKLAGFSGNYIGKVCNELYKQLLYNYHINAKARGKSPYIQYITEDEWEYVNKVFSAMCVAYGTTPSKIFTQLKLEVA